MGIRKTKDLEFDFPIIDMHAHFLPGMDDGSRTMEETIQLLRAAAQQGMNGAVATPHFSGRRKSIPVQERLEEVREAIQDILPDFVLYGGCEHFYREMLAEQLADLYGVDGEDGEVSENNINDANWKTLAGSKYVLVEFEVDIPFEQLFRGIRRLSGAGFRPILAHVERYGCLRKEERLLELMRIGCIYQMNYDSLKGSMFSMETRWCRKQVLSGRISLLGTDMHRTDFRPPDIEEALVWLKKHLEPEELRRILYENPMKVLNPGNTNGKR